MIFPNAMHLNLFAIFRLITGRQSLCALTVLLGVFLGAGEAVLANSEEGASYVPEVDIVPSVAKPFVRELNLSAVTESPRMVEVSTQASGIVDTVVAVEGEIIAKDAVIATLRGDARAEHIAAAKAELRQRELEYRAAKKLAKSGLRAETALAESYYRLKQAQVSLKEAQLDADYSVIKSPFNGVLNRIYVHEGDKVKSLDTNVAQLLTIHPMLAVGYVPEKWRQHIGQGTSAKVALGEDYVADGVVNYVSMQSEDATRTYRVEVQIDNPLGTIPAGMTADVVIPIDQINAHLVPSSALSLADDGQLQIKHIDDQNQVLADIVKIVGESDDGLWLLGLPEHINLISYGQAFVKVGDYVNIRSAR